LDKRKLVHSNTNKRKLVHSNTDKLKLVLLRIALLRFDPQKSAAVLVRQRIKQAIRALAHVANALMQVDESSYMASDG
jgi:hypothetical protein